MANPEHLEILHQGRSAWNQWRQERRGIRADLTCAYLSETSMEWAEPDVPGELDVADFEGFDFSGVSLAYARLQGANLRGANLVGANLRGANLRRADLRHADLREVKFFSANLTLANLSYADVTGAIFWETVLARVNLNSTVGLEWCRHGGPSIVDERTLRRSGGLPVAFLRGCGVSDPFIKYLPKLIKSRRFYSCFISYSAKDEGFALQLHKKLQSRGVRCWFDREDMKIGDRIRPSVDSGIQSSDKLLLILSEHSVTSAWVESEVETAFEKERSSGDTVLFPIRLDDSVMQTQVAWASEIRRTRNIGDFRKWKDPQGYREAFSQLIEALRSAARTRRADSRDDT